jgi:hypothetical protein
VSVVVDADPGVVVEAAAGAAAREPTTVLARARPTSSRARDARRGWEDASWTPLVEPGKTHASYLPEHRGEERDDGARRQPGQTRRTAIPTGSRRRNVRGNGSWGARYGNRALRLSGDDVSDWPVVERPRDRSMPTPKRSRHQPDRLSGPLTLRPCTTRNPEYVLTSSCGHSSTPDSGRPGVLWTSGLSDRRYLRSSRCLD